MSWRFRKTFKVFPGVKLNLTRSGISATFGSAPFSINVGPRGVYRNISIPGTGLWSRDRIDVTSPSPQHLSDGTPPSPFPPRSAPIATPPALPPTIEIRSASTETLNSQPLEGLRKLLSEAYQERDTLKQEVSKAEQEAGIAARRYQDWERGFLLKRIFTRSFATRRDAHETAQAKLEELREQLRLTVIATQIEIDREQAEPYYKMRDDFASLCECQKIWDTLTRRAVDRVVERSTANEVITRERVGFSLDCCDLIQWEHKVPHLPNCNGGDLFVFPGFVLYTAAKHAFALIDTREVRLDFRPVRFIETEPVPTDTQIVAHDWAKSNKDGTPDRRFRNNYQIPVVLYGSLSFRSPSGLHEEYQFSNPALAERFARSWRAFTVSFSQTGEHK